MMKLMLDKKIVAFKLLMNSPNPAGIRTLSMSYETFSVLQIMIKLRGEH